MSKIIDNQGLEGGMGYCSNASKTIGKTDFDKEGVATCSQQWNTSYIHKCNPEGRLHAEKNQQDCGAPPPPGEDWSGLNPSMLSTN